jgi:hypothetical protein
MGAWSVRVVESRLRLLRILSSEISWSQGLSASFSVLVVGAGCRFFDIPFDRPASEAAEQDPAEAPAA